MRFDFEYNGCIGVVDVVAVEQCEHIRGVLCNLFVAIRAIVVVIRKKNAQCEWALRMSINFQRTHLKPSSVFTFVQCEWGIHTSGKRKRNSGGY